MKFSIIIPTYRRRQLLVRAIDSVRSQSYRDWELIVVNDAPDDETYAGLKTMYVNDARVRYFVNPENRGVNYSRNRGLDLVSGDITHVIFLDDDDYLSPNALASMADVLETTRGAAWLVTNRAEAGGRSYTTAPADATFYNYARDYLIGRRIKGDATHCIMVDLVQNVRFPTLIKQAEEWLFYMELGRSSAIYYRDLDTTYTDGYLEGGLNDRRRPRKTEIEVMKRIWREARRRGLLTTPYFYVYYLMRFVRLLIRR